MDKNQLKERVIRAIEENKDIIINIGRKIYNNPEFGYKEFETTKSVVEFFKNELNIENIEENIAYTVIEDLLKTTEAILNYIIKYLK